jgi:anaerobic dimethyl sulfoxide reductase subunit B
MEPLIVFDAKKCICCHSCEVACQLENDAPPGLQLRMVKTHVSGKFPAGVPLSISTACFHCNSPSCVSACPAGALHRRTDGVVAHDRNRCIGCGYCIQTCPFHVPQFSPTQHTMRKCSFCTQRIDRGKLPACAAKCATGALRFFPDRRSAESISSAYGKDQNLHMIYRIEGKPGEYSLPDPVPLNTVTSLQVWKWLAGLVPGAVVLGWLWKRAEDVETNHD